ncbi:hypothetical protein [Amnibacterium sp.]|uniref:hypothetical protein n=1 Tax=Amnibacterium sp. TaxID=1872496 RepID=UPI0026046FEC|nr:hypothetical protein [Amnibacterium sp.]
MARPYALTFPNIDTSGDRGVIAVQFEVPAGNALIFSRPDGSLLAVPEARPMTRPIAVV